MKGCATSSPAAILRFLSCWKAHICSSLVISTTKNAAKSAAARPSSQPSGVPRDSHAWCTGEVKSHTRSNWLGMLKLMLSNWNQGEPIRPCSSVQR